MSQKEEFQLTYFLLPAINLMENSYYDGVGTIPDEILFN